MENLEFNVDQRLFKGRPTYGYYLFSAKQKKDSNVIIAKYINIDEDSNKFFHVEIMPHNDRNVAKILKQRYESFEYIVSVNSPKYYEDVVVKEDLILCENEILRKKLIFSSIWGLINCPVLAYAIVNFNESRAASIITALISTFMIYKGAQSVSQIKQLNDYIEEMNDNIYDLIVNEGKRITRRHKK